MATIGPLRQGVVADAGLRVDPIGSRRPCARPSCSAPATATLTFRYATREAWLERLVDHRDPQAYDLCVTHAARTRPPEGWQLRDRRPDDERRPDEPHTTPVDLGGDRTVAVLAAALRSVPDPVSEDVIADHAEVDRAVDAPLEPAASDGPTLLALDLEADPTREAAGWLSQLAEADPAGTSGAAPAGDEPPLGRPPLAVRDRDAAQPG